MTLYYLKKILVWIETLWSLNYVFLILWRLIINLDTRYCVLLCCYQKMFGAIFSDHNMAAILDF